MKNLEKSFEKLNIISSAKSLPVGSVKFYYGDAFARAIEIICKLIPFGKVCLLCSENDYENKYSAFIKELNERGIKSQILASPTDSDLTSVLENVRLVMAFDNEYYNLANKIASDRKIYSLLATTTFNFDNLLSAYYVEKGKEIFYDCDRRIIFDAYKIVKDEKGSANEFAFVMSKLISLIDFRIYGVITGKAIDKKAYTLIKEAVEETYSLFSMAREEYLLTLLINSIIVRFANLLTNGEFIKNSAVDTLAFLHKEKETLLPYAKKLAKVYAVTFSSKYDGVAEPDYLERMERVLKYSAVKEAKLSKWIVYQGALCNEKKLEIELIKELIFNEVKEYIKIFEKVEKTYIALGGKLIETDSELIKVSGDFYNTFNGMTLATNAGVSEFI